MFDRVVPAGASVSNLIDLMDEPPFRSPEITETQRQRVNPGEYEVNST